MTDLPLDVRLLLPREERPMTDVKVTSEFLREERSYLLDVEGVSVQFEFRRENGGDWSVTSVEVTGPNLKARPDWVISLIDRYHPDRQS